MHEHETARYNALSNFPREQASQNAAPATKSGRRASPNAALATKSKHLWHQGTNMREPVTMRFPISQESRRSQNRRTPHAKIKFITLESNVTIRFWRQFHKKVKIITLELRQNIENIFFFLSASNVTILTFVLRLPRKTSITLDSNVTI